MSDLKIIPEDESHFQAHEHEMTINRKVVYELIKKGLVGSRRSGEVKIAVKSRFIVGLSGIRKVRPANKRSFWDKRKGRNIPSHLVKGKRKPTKWLCFWGYWKDSQTFMLTTFYPGKPAPREIHDPTISSEELKKAVRFWSTHALVVESD